MNETPSRLPLSVRYCFQGHALPVSFSGSKASRSALIGRKCSEWTLPHCLSSFFYCFWLLLRWFFAVKAMARLIRFFVGKNTCDKRVDFFKELGSFCRTFFIVGLCFYFFMILTAFYVKYSLFWVFVCACGVLAAAFLVACRLALSLEKKILESDDAEVNVLPPKS